MKIATAQLEQTIEGLEHSAAQLIVEGNHGIAKDHQKKAMQLRLAVMILENFSNEKVEVINNCYHHIGKQVSNFTLKLSRREPSPTQTRSHPTVERYVKFHDSDTEYQLPLEATATAVEFRKFCISCGNYHWCGGQSPIDQLMLLLDNEYDAENQKPQQ